MLNRIPDDVREQVLELALDEPELSPRACDALYRPVSEASVYRLLKAHDLIASPAFIVMKAADEFEDKTTAPDQLWQTELKTEIGRQSTAQRSVEADLVAAGACYALCRSIDDVHDVLVCAGIPIFVTLSSRQNIWLQ